MTWNEKMGAMYRTLIMRDPSAEERWPTMERFQAWMLERRVGWQRPIAGPSDYWQCFYCPRQIQYVNLSLDHVVPLKFGGDSSADNTVLCCGSCQMMKHTLPEDRFVALLAFIQTIPDDPPTEGKGQTQREAFEGRLRRHLFGQRRAKGKAKR